MRTKHKTTYALLACLGFMMTAEASTHVYTDTELLAMAAAHSADELHHLTLGDKHYTVDGAYKGYIYLCGVPPSNGRGGAGVDGPWIHGDTWNPDERVSVSGDQVWQNAVFTVNTNDVSRFFSGNGLPISHATGIFPIQPNDPAFQYDRNPNSISAQSYQETLLRNPTYHDQPSCMGMEVGIMLTGVALFNGFDAELRDAAAHEVQDKCNGHPQQHGQYHYHNLSRCIAHADVHTVIGYALDGFPITGGEVVAGKNLMTSDLDECHGLTSEIYQDGQPKISYHYVMTPDFPYSVSCFRGDVESRQVNNGQSSGNPQPNMQRRSPPPEALNACANHTPDSACGFITPRGDQINGTCRQVANNELACVPQR